MRPSPSESATLFKPGFIKIGNDGNQWIVIETKNSIRKWQRYDESTIRFKSLKKYGSMTFDDGQVCYGDISFDCLSMKPGMYDVFSLDDNLLLCHHDMKLTKNKLNGLIFDYIDEVGVDTGTFGFRSNNISEHLSTLIDRSIIYEVTLLSPEMLDRKKYKGDSAIIATLSRTYYGDGFFPVYRNGNDIIILIAGETLYDNINIFDNNLPWKAKL